MHREFPSSPKAPARPAWLRHVIALACVVMGWLLREALSPAIGPTALPFITFFPAVAVAAWLGGVGPGVVAVLWSVLASDWFFVEPRYSLAMTGSDAVALASFAAASAFIVAAIGAMHRARAELVGSRDLLATTLSSIGDAVIVTDRQGRVTFLNPEAERLCGWSRAEAAGRPLPEVFRIVQEGTRGPAASPVERVLRTGMVVGLANHTLLIARDGTETPIDDSAAPVREADGPVTGVVLVFRDVREQRAAQKMQAQLSAIVRYSGDAILTKDLDGIIRSWNESAERLFGYTAGEAIGRPITMLIPDDRLEEEPLILARLRQGLPSDRLETVRRTKDGRLLHVSLSVSPLKDAEGNVMGAAKIVHDITDVVVARGELARERELLATTLASIGDAVIMTGIDGQVTYLNREAERVTGWPQAEAKGRPLPEVFRIVNEATRQPVENPVDKVLRLGGVVGLANHTVLIGRDGRETPIDDSAAPIHQPGGALFGVVLVFRDVAERRAAERALRQADRKKDEFLAVLSHELRNPLAPIRLAIGMMQELGPPQRELRELVEVIARQTTQLSRLLDDLLDVGRITSGKIVLRKERITLGQALANALEAGRPLIDSLDHRLEVVQPPDPIPLDADLARLSQVFANLLNNAAKYTERGGRIQVEVVREGDCAAVHVRDNGIGIQQAQLPRLFAMFAQGDHSMGHGKGGLGVGLALARQMVELHGGTIEARSAGLGTGSEFTVRLPIAAGAAGAAAPAAALPPAGRMLRILVADDNADSALLLAAMLRHLGHDVATAFDGAEALATAERTRPDVAILDIGMPRMNGLEVARSIRRKVGAPMVLIAMTGWGQEEDRRVAREAGFDHHLTKPMEFPALQRLLGELRPADPVG